MAKGQRKSNKEIRKPKAKEVKVVAANATAKGRDVSIVTLKD